MNPANIVGLIRNGLTLEAEAAMRAAGLSTGKSAVALLLQGLLAEARGDVETAFAKLARAAKLEPRDAALAADAGRLAHTLGRVADACDLYGRAARLRPDDVELLYALGQCQIALRSFGPAETTMRRVLDRMPGHRGAIANLGGLLRRGNRLDEAEALFLSVEGYIGASAVTQSLGDLYLLRGDLETAVALCRARLAVEDDDDLAYAYAMTLLAQGKFAEGWRLHERRGIPELDDGLAHLRPWDGEPTSETVLLHSEQGRGDTIQFCRFAEIAARRAPNLCVLVPPRMRRLIGSLASVPVVSAARDVAGATRRASLMSLPHLLTLTDEQLFCERMPYLRVDGDLAAAWRQRLGPNGLKIGVAWQGNESWTSNTRRAFPLQMLRPLARLPGVRLIALQTGDALKDIKALSPKFPVETYPLDAGADGFVDTAAVIAHCDLVISTDTSIAHLAGALGAPTWLALSFNPDWRWMRGRTDTPWYPTMRLFRQRKLDDWGQVFADMAAALPAFRAERGV